MPTRDTLAQPRRKSRVCRVLNIRSDLELLPVMSSLCWGLDLLTTDRSCVIVDQCFGRRDVLED